VLAYQTGGAGGVGTDLLWVDRTGKTISALGDRAFYTDLNLSPDAQRAAVAVLDPATGNRDIWLVDIARGVRTRFTFDSANERRAVWSPDATRVIFDSIRKGTYDLYQKSSTGNGSEETILQTEREDFPSSWSPDGSSLLYRSAGQWGDLWLLPLTGDRKPSPFLQTPFDKATPQFSPDGRWVAYVSNESGRDEVYVTPFPKPDGKWQISTEGGVYPRWRRDGQELFYSAPGGRLIGVAVSGKGAGIDVGVAKVLFQNDVALGYPYDVSADGQRFLIISNRNGQAAPDPLTIVLNWAAGMKR
jgi:Tol biopolymer transport system component